MKQIISLLAALVLTIGFLGTATTTHAQTYGGNGQFTFYSNANGQYWCYANGDVTFQSVSGAITWSTAGSPNAIPCPVPAVAAVASYAAPVTYTAPVSTCAYGSVLGPYGCTSPYIAQPYVQPYVSPCASVFGFGFNNFGFNNGCGNGCFGGVIGCNGCQFSCFGNRFPFRNPTPVCGRNQHLVPVSPATTPVSYTCVAN